MAGERRTRSPRVRPTAAAAVADARNLATWLPSGRSVLIGLATLVVCLGLYGLARTTSMFAIERIEVEGASAGVATRVRAALEPVAGSSLVAFDATEANSRLASVPMVASATYDRDFPHTLVVTVIPETPIALLRRGSATWVVSESGRVLRKVAAPPLPDLPRVWLPATADPLVGTVIADESAAAVEALAAIGDVRLPTRIRSVKLTDGEVSMTLASGARVLLGNRSELALKVAVAARVLEVAPLSATVDVSVPERPVATETASTEA